MWNIRLLVTGTVGILILLSGGAAEAIPGQSLDEARTWIRAHPTLQPAPGEQLLVRKSDSPARRFIFQVSTLSVGRVGAALGGGTVRAEEFSLFDMTNGVTRGRLDESLRVIYGASIYQDYTHASVVYTYPGGTVGTSPSSRQPSTQSGIQGELRDGDRYAYWIEIAKQPNGYAYIGKLTIFLKEDLPKLDAELQRRYAVR
jgi:hypothetical protein